MMTVIKVFSRKWNVHAWRDIKIHENINKYKK